MKEYSNFVEFDKELKKLEIFDKKTRSLKGYFRGQESRYKNNYRLIKRELKKTDFILDIGTNPPYFMATLKQIGHHIEGLDMNPDLDSELIKERDLNISKCNIEVERFPYEDRSFDVIILSEVFEHLYVNPIHTMNEIRRVLKNNGKLILTTPNGYSVKRVANFILGRGLSENPYREFDLLNRLGYRGHIREYSLGEVNDFLKKTGFLIQKSKYISFVHYGLKKSVILKDIVNVIYLLFPPLRSHFVIIARRKVK